MSSSELAVDARAVTRYEVAVLLPCYNESRAAPMLVAVPSIA